MTDEEFTQRKHTLDLQLEANIALLRDSHHAQVRALERLWSATRDEPTGAVETPTPKAAAPAPVKRRKHRAAGSLYDEVVSALDQISGDFDKNDVYRLLATAPERSSLFRVLRKLEDERRIEAREFGSGRRTTTYRKTESVALRTASEPAGVGP
jgi:hypothetical protein